MRSILTLFLFCAALGRLSAEAPPVDGSMPEDYVPALRPILKTAVESAPTTIIANLAVAQAHAASYLQSAPLYPNISGSTFYQVSVQSESSSTSTTEKGLYYTANVSQPVFQWGAYKNQAALGHLGELVAERQFDEAYRLLAVNIREQFVALVQKKVLVRNGEFTLKLAKESLTAQQARFDAGSSSQAELSSYQLAVEQAQLDADRTEEDYRYSKQLLIRLAGVDSLADDAIPLELPHPEFAPAKADAIVAGFVGGGVESVFQAQVYDLLAKEADLNYRIAKVRLLPKVGLNAAFSYENYSEPIGPKVQQIGIQSESYNAMVTWQIFDGFTTTGLKKSALANKRSDERQRQTFIDNAIDQISDIRHWLGFSVRAMTLAEVHTALLDAQVKRLTQDQTLGYASQAAIESGASSLYNSQYLQAVARSDFYNRWTEFVSLAGIDPALANLSSAHGH